VVRLDKEKNSLFCLNKYFYSGTQSPTPMSSTTRVKTSSGQTIITRNNSSSDRPATYCIRSSVRIKKKQEEEKNLYFIF